MKKVKQWMMMGGCMLFLTACGETTEEKAEMAVAHAQDVLNEEVQSATAGTDMVSLYLPSGFSVETSQEEMNFKLYDKKHEYILFVNELEEENSQLSYELLQEDSTKQILHEQTYEQDGQFGFMAISEVAEDQYELIASIGGKKLTTITAEKDMDDVLTTMVEIVRSVQSEK